MIYKMFDAEDEEALISKINYIFSQFQELQRFINVLFDKKKISPYDF